MASRLRVCSRPAPRPRRAALATALLVAVLAAPMGSAAAGIVSRLPVPSPGSPRPVSVLTGMNCVVSTGDAEGYGYHAVRFRFSSPAPSNGERRLTVRFSASSTRGPRSTRRASVVVEREGVLPVGATGAELVLPTPYFEPWTSVWWDVWVDGVRDPALSVAKNKALPTPQPEGSESLSVLSLIRGVAGPDVVTQLTLRPSDQMRLASSTLLDAWTDYTPYDAVVVDVSTLAELKQTEPERFGVLLRWVASGGALWVASVSKDDYGRLDTLIEADRVHGWSTDEADELGSPADGWSWVWLRARRTESDPAKSVDEFLEEKAAEVGNRRRGDRGWFAERRYGFGMVTAFLPEHEARRDAGRFAGRRFALPRFDQQQPNNPKQSAAIEHLAGRAWSTRHGLEPDAANDGFSSLLPPGVGTAPVVEFQVLITLFAIVAGPLNFWLLKRRQRTHLIVLTVPLLAAVITLLLLAYALLGDGFGTRVRVREVTLIDQAQGRRTTWARMSYYSGLAPSDGFTLPTECAMYPILAGWNDLGLASVSAAPREIAWSDTAQRLRGGWLRSRATTQYLQVLSAPTDKRIEVTAAGGDPTVVNRLGARLAWLLVVDADGRLLLAEGVADGGEASLKPVARDQATRDARRRVIRAEPFPPDGLAGDDTLMLVDQEKRVLRKRLQRELNLSYASVRLGDNRLNQLLDELIGLAGDKPLALRPRSYLAFAESAVGAEIGIDGARQVGGFHAVMGGW